MYLISTVDIIGDKNIHDTAALIASKEDYTKAIIVNANKSVADGLSASGLSGTVDDPILLTKKDTLPLETSSKLNGVKKVYIIGGPSIMNDKLVTDTN